MRSSFTGFIMSKDKVVAIIENNKIVDYDSTLAPLYILRTKDFEGWLRLRSIDLHRTNSRILRKILRLNTYDELELILQTNASTITDTYWIRNKEDTLTFKAVCNKSLLLSDTALTGDMNIFDADEKTIIENINTPELTNIGNYEKCWKLENKEWYMHKSGTDFERFSELFTYFLGTELNLKMAEYNVHAKYTVSKNFTNNWSVNFEPMYAIIGDNEDYIENINCLRTIDNKLVKEYLDLIFLDAIVFNVDRHTFNYGVMRDIETGKIISMAPNFDNNLSLISRGYRKSVERNDLLVTYFVDAVRDTKFNIPYITEDTILKCIILTLNKINIDINRQYIVNTCMNAYKNILKVL